MNYSKRAQKGVTKYDRLKADDGYTLFSPQGRTDSILIDMEGNIVNRWRFKRIPGEHAVLLKDGNLLRSELVNTPDELGMPEDAAGLGGEFLIVNWDGNELKRFKAPHQTHAFCMTEEGNLLYPDVHPEGVLSEELSKKWKGGIPGTEHEGRIWGDGIVEMDLEGNILWKWRPAEYLDPEIDAICHLEPRNHFHANAVWKCMDGNMLFSCRSLNQVLKIEYPGGKVIGRYGRGKIFHQHDCRELSNGNILVFDNGTHRPGYGLNYSRVVEIDINTDEIVWEYRTSTFYSSHCSGAQRLPNGNTLICDTFYTRFLEVTEDKQIVWEYINPFVGIKELTKDYMINSPMVFRAYRYPRDYEGLKGIDLNPGRVPWENQLYGPKAIEKEFRPVIL